MRFCIEFLIDIYQVSFFVIIGLSFFTTINFFMKFMRISRKVTINVGAQPVILTPKHGHNILSKFWVGLEELEMKGGRAF